MPCLLWGMVPHLWKRHTYSSSVKAFLLPLKLFPISCNKCCFPRTGMGTNAYNTACKLNTYCSSDRWVCWVLQLFPWPLWRKIHTRPYLHFSTLPTCLQHWPNQNPSSSLSWVSAGCPQQGEHSGCHIVYLDEYIISRCLHPRFHHTTSLQL